MKKTLLLIILLSGTILWLPSCKETNEKIPALHERSKEMGPDQEKVTIKSTYEKAIAALKKNPEDLQQYINLASVYITEGRITRRQQLLQQRSNKDAEQCNRKPYRQ